MESRPSVFKRAWAMLWARPAAYAVVAILPHVVILGLVMLIGRVVLRVPPQASEQDPMTLWQSMDWGSKLLIILAEVALITVPAYVAARGICRLALEQQKNVSVSLGAVLSDMLSFLPVALLYFLVLGIVTFLGSMFVIPGLLATTWFALIIPAGIDGQLGPLAAIRRGVSLVRTVFGQVFGAYACYLALVIGGGVVMAIFLSVMTGGEDSSSGFLMPLGLFLLVALYAYAPLNIMFTLLYCEARDESVSRMTAAAPMSV
jgi:hypothetical protein